MRCRNKNRKGGGCRNHLGDARYLAVGTVVRCSGCWQTTVVNRGHILRDTLKAINNLQVSIGRPSIPQPQFLSHY